MRRNHRAILPTAPDVGKVEIGTLMPPLKALYRLKDDRNESERDAIRGIADRAISLSSDHKLSVERTDRTGSTRGGTGFSWALHLLLRRHVPRELPLQPHNVLPSRTHVALRELLCASGPKHGVILCFSLYDPGSLGYC